MAKKKERSGLVTIKPVEIKPRSEKLKAVLQVLKQRREAEKK